jgi:hypothetical protein
MSWNLRCSQHLTIKPRTKILLCQKNKIWTNSYIHLKCINIWHNSWFCIQEFWQIVCITLTWVHMLVLSYEYSVVCMLILFMLTLNFGFITYIELWYTSHFNPSIVPPVTNLYEHFYSFHQKHVWSFPCGVMYILIHWMALYLMFVMSEEVLGQYITANRCSPHLFCQLKLN